MENAMENAIYKRMMTGGTPVSETPKLSNLSGTQDMIWTTYILGACDGEYMHLVLEPMVFVHWPDQ